MTLYDIKPRFQDLLRPALRPWGDGQSGHLYGDAAVDPLWRSAGLVPRSPALSGFALLSVLAHGAQCH